MRTGTRSSVVSGIGVLAVAALALGACSTEGDADAESTSTAPPATIAPPDDLPAFYGVPDPLPDGEPGDIIAAEEIDVPEIDGTVWRVMYHSEAVEGDDIAVTGLIVEPLGEAPEGGWPVVSWAHGTTGIDDQCAPSAEPAGLAGLANPLIERGYAVTATDYEGMGTPGRHPYIAGISEARGTLDIVRAAQSMQDVDVSDDYLVWGHSQGGHAAMFTLEIGPTWSPELNQVGVVAGAPPSQLLLINAALQQSPFRYYITMAAAGLNAAYGDDDAPLDAVLTAEGLEFLDNVDDGCTAELSDAAEGIEDFATIQVADPADVPAWNELLVANDPGQFTTAKDAPLLIIQGGDDEQIPVASSALLFDQLCAIGQVTQRWVYPGLSHAGVVEPSGPDMLRWIDDRFAGEPAPDPYQPVGPPVPETQSCPSA